MGRLIAPGAVRLPLRARHRSQGGYILSIVLAAMSVGLLLITALLGLSFTSQRAAIAQQELARDVRAADGALDTALTQIRRDHSAGGDPCTELTLSQVAVEGTVVDLTCATAMGATDPAAGQTLLLGQPEKSGDPVYLGNVGWQNQWVSTLSTAGLSPDSEVTGSDPAFVHVGDQPARFVGSVGVGTGGLPLGPAGGPGAQVVGSYAQGDPGPYTPGDDSNPCGILSAGDTRLDPAHIEVDQGSLTCQDIAAPGDPGQPPAIPVMAPTSATIPSPSSCPASSVTLSPGLYDSLKVAALNDLMVGCPGLTYVFPPSGAESIYYFDAPNPGRALVLQGIGSSFVFGVPHPGEPSRCDTSQAGSTVVLSGSTTFRHLSGQLSMCGAAIGGVGNSWALVRDNSVPSFIRPVLGSVASIPGVWGFVDSQYAIEPADSAGGSAIANFTCSIPGANCERGFQFDVDAAGTREVQGLDFVWTALNEPPASIGHPFVRVQVKAPVSGAVLCETSGAPQAGWAYAGVTSNIQASVPLTCGSPIEEAELDGAVVAVTFKYIGSGWLNGRVSIRGASLRPRGVVANAATVVVPSGSAWQDAGNASGPPDAGVVTYPEAKCTMFSLPNVPALRVCERPGDPSYQWLEARGFDLSALADDAQLDSLAVRVTPEPGSDKLATNKSYVGVSNGRLMAQVVKEDGTTICAGAAELEELGYTTSYHRWELDLFENDTCTNALATAGDLHGAVLRVGIQPEKGIKCAGIPGCTAAVQQNYGLEMPKIDSIQLVATSTSVDDHMAAQVTVDEGLGTGARIDGEVFLPSVSLDVVWKGTASADPLVHGPLVLNALGSEVDAGAETGIICCSALSDEVVLTAKVGGTVLGVARARIEDDIDPLATAVVMSWDLCSRAGCPEINPGPGP